MNVGFQAFNINPIQNAGAKNVSYPKVKNGPVFDVFQKSDVSFKGVSQSYGWSKARICSVYDKTYEDVIKLNPIVKELNMEKPDVLFPTEWPYPGALTAYNIVFNTIEVAPELSEDYYILVIRDSKGNIATAGRFASESTVKAQQDFIKKHKNLEYIKLNDCEKEKLISALMAHELRHCIQDHMLLSTEGCEEHLNAVKRQAKSAKIVFLSNITRDKAFGRKPNKIDLYYSERPDYILNYEPKKMLNRGTVLKFSMDPRDKKAFSVVEHFLPTADFDTRINQITNEYYAQPFEIDAYNFEYEYLARLMNKKSIADNSRPDVVRAMTSVFRYNTNLGKSLMQINGYPPFKKVQA